MATLGKDSEITKFARLVFEHPLLNFLEPAVFWISVLFGLFIVFIFLCQIDGGVGCNLFEWVGDPMDKYQQDLVRDLRDAVWDRDDEIERLQEEILLLAGRKQCNDELKNQALKNQAMKMQADGGNSLFIVWVLSVAFAIYCTWVMCSNWNFSLDCSAARGKLIVELSLAV